MPRFSFFVLLLAAGTLMAGEAGTVPASGSPGAQARPKRPEAAKIERPPDSYMAEIHDAIYRKWEHPRLLLARGQAPRSTIKIRIARDGQISRIELVKASGFVALDESVLKAAKAVERLTPLPASYHGDHFDVPIQFILDSE
jgi:TonB family protein